MPSIKHGDSSNDRDSNKMRLSSFKIEYTLFIDVDWSREIIVIIASSRQLGMTEIGHQKINIDCYVTVTYLMVGHVTVGCVAVRNLTTTLIIIA